MGRHVVLLLACVILACSIANVRGVAWSASRAKVIQSLAWSSYCPFSVVKKWSCYWCTKSGAPKLTNVLTAYNAKHDNFAYGGIEKRSNSIFVVFRGTAVTSVKDWVEDSNFKLIHIWKDQPKASVHSGFSGAWGSLRSTVYKVISSLKKTCPKCSLNLVGHSLGGGMATLAAVDLRRSNIKVSSLVTLGCPRVGNSQFASYFGSLHVPHVRWVHKHDVVPHVPLTHMGFHHVTQEYWSTDGKSFRQCSATNGEDQKCAAGLHFWDYSVSDHLNYLNVNLAAGKPFHCDGVYDNKS